MTNNAVIVDALRTPVGRYGGSLRDVRPDDLGAILIRALMEHTVIDLSTIDDVMWSCANQAGEDNRNVGRMSALLAGIPSTVPATMLNIPCRRTRRARGNVTAFDTSLGWRYPNAKMREMFPLEGYGRDCGKRLRSTGLADGNRMNLHLQATKRRLQRRPDHDNPAS